VSQKMNISHKTLNAHKTRKITPGQEISRTMKYFKLLN